MLLITTECCVVYGNIFFCDVHLKCPLFAQTVSGLDCTAVASVHCVSLAQSL